MKLHLSRLYHKSVRLAVLGLAFAALQGCGMIYKSTGDILVSYGKSDMMPYVMTYDDVPMACSLGEAQTLLLMSFESVGSNPDKMATMVFNTAAGCSEQRSLDAQLRYLRDIKIGDVSGAQDARIEQKRWAANAAKRQLVSYNRTIKAFGNMKDGQCPKLKSDFDQMVWMVGMLSGMQALLNDTTADGSVGVPRNIAANAAMGATCLDSEKWWGVPDAMRGAVWNMLPMLAPEGTDSWKILENATKTGFKKGVRLASAMYAMAAYSKGDDARLKSVIRDFVANGKNINPNYKLLDAIAGDMILGLSDRLWTQATGKRTPYGELGTFWDDAKSQPKVDINDLLN